MKAELVEDLLEDGLTVSQANSRTGAASLGDIPAPINAASRTLAEVSSRRCHAR